MRPAPRSQPTPSLIFIFADDRTLGVAGSPGELWIECELPDILGGTYRFFDCRGKALRVIPLTKPATNWFERLLTAPGPNDFRLNPSGDQAAPDLSELLADTAGFLPNPYFSSVEAIREHLNAANDTG
jgi:hypothetical protein